MIKVESSDDWKVKHLIILSTPVSNVKNKLFLWEKNIHSFISSLVCSVSHGAFAGHYFQPWINIPLVCCEYFRDSHGVCGTQRK